MNRSSGLVLIEPLLEEALAKPVEKPKHRKGVNITLACEPGVSLREIADRLKVRGEGGVFDEVSSEETLASVGPFGSFEITEPISPRAFINLRATRKMHRSANPREILAFIESYPARARRQSIVCLCSGRLIMSHKTGFPAMIVFEPRDGGFFARVDYDSVEIPAGALVIMKVSR